LLFDILCKGKAVAILLALYKGAKFVRELQEATSGSYTTIQKRISELLDAKLIEDEYLTGGEFGEKPIGKRLLRLSEKGRSVTESLLDSKFVKLPLLDKDRMKWILLISSTLGKIRGKTRFMKLLFLLRKEYSFRRGNFFKFEPWLYGPFSEDIEMDLSELENQNLISKRALLFFEEEASEEKTLYEYSLTTQGERIAREISQDLSRHEIETLMELKKFNRMKLKTLLKYVYRKYPKYVTKSKITETILQ